MSDDIATMSTFKRRKPLALSEYKNQLTLDGRIKLQPGVTKRKVEAVRFLMEGALAGDRSAKGHLEEVLTSSDAIFNYAHLLSINLLPQFDALEPTWSAVAGTRLVSDFRPAVLYSLVSRFANVEQEGADAPSAGQAPHGIAPIVPELGVYPLAYMSGEESISGGIAKRGLQTDFSFEAYINDSVGFIQALPGELLNVATDTPDYEVYQALINGTGSSQELQGGTVPDGTTVLPNAPLSRAALVRAIYELKLRKINNRYVQINGGFNLIVPIGQKEFVEFWINQAIAQVADGSLTLTVSGYNPLANVKVIETEWVTGTNWYLLPQPGATRRPVLDYAYLIGHADPEVRVKTDGGTLIGGGAISPFEGSFDNDSAKFRLRQIGGAILWTPGLVVTSNGSGTA